MIRASTTPGRAFWTMFLAGLLPMVAANAAFMINAILGMEACFPYWEGCMSVSRGIRSGPGLWLFKGLAMPSALMMWLAWRSLDAHPGTDGFRHPHLRWAITLGKVGAVFFVVYALWLGSDGEIYRWLRRYGVVLYFGLTGLAQLLLLPAWPRSEGRANTSRRLYAAVVLLAWGTGIASAFKRKLIEDPRFLDRVENVLEWHFALYLSLGFVALALALRKRRHEV